MIQSRDNSWGAWAPLPLRLMLAIGFLFHGIPKLLGGHAGTVAQFQSLGIPLPEVAAWVVALVEVLGAIALLIGAFTVLVSVILIIEMLVAMLLVHLPHGFGYINITGMGPEGPVFGMPGYEVNLLYISALLALAIGGAGAWSVDGSSGEGRTTNDYTMPPAA